MRSLILVAALLVPISAHAGSVSLTITDGTNKQLMSSQIDVDDSVLSQILATFRETMGVEIKSTVQIPNKPPMTTTRDRTDAELWNMIFETGWNYVTHYTSQVQQQKAAEAAPRIAAPAAAKTK